jgi:hypothetical protein
MCFLTFKVERTNHFQIYNDIRVDMPAAKDSTISL